MTKRVMGSVRAELLKMKHTFLIPFHVAVPVIIAGFMLFYYRGTIGNPMGQTMAYFELIGIGLPFVVSIVCAGNIGLEEQNHFQVFLGNYKVKGKGFVVKGVVLFGMGVLAIFGAAVAVAGLTLFSMMGQMLLESVGNLKMRQAIPIPAQILAGIVLWLTTLWEIPFCLLLAQKISTFLMLVIHVGIYSILSTSVSLKPWFALFPGAITSRLMCVVIKVMPNGLPFEPGQVTYSPELGRVSGLLIGIPAALLWFLVFWLAGRTWFRKQVAE